MNWLNNKFLQKLTLVIVVLITSTSLNAEKVDDVAFIFRNGLFPYGYDYVDGNFLVIKETNNAPSELKTWFGIEYGFYTTFLEEKDIKEELKVTHITIYPGKGIQNPKSKKLIKRDSYPITLQNANSQNNLYQHGFVFDHEWEIIEGPWIFQVWLRDRMIVEHTINVISKEEFERPLTLDTIRKLTPLKVN